MSPFLGSVPILGNVPTLGNVPSQGSVPIQGIVPISDLACCLGLDWCAAVVSAFIRCSGFVEFLQECLFTITSLFKAMWCGE